MSGLTVNSPLVVYGLEVAIFTSIAWRKEIRDIHLPAAIASWQME
jgi:hypothetical protein